MPNAKHLSESPAAQVAPRQALIQNLFPGGIPSLWCPTLTHFASAHTLDRVRIGAHFKFLAPFVKGILVPGSTGEGWEMNDAEIRQLLEVVLATARGLGMRVLVGALKADAEQALDCIESTVTWLKAESGAGNGDRALQQCGVAGFTICPPRGRDLSQTAIQSGLRKVLDRGLPTALYQLPQVTSNEMSPETVSALAQEYSNFYLFKDTSGQDRVATSGLDFGGVFLVRGAEGGYARWPKSGGGSYDGFLLSTANVFAAQLRAIQSALVEGREPEAQALAQRVDTVVKQCFEMVAGFPVGNPFTNANKVLDHIMGYGPRAVQRVPPLLYSGRRLPEAWISTAVELLRKNSLLPSAGYVDSELAA